MATHNINMDFVYNNIDEIEIRPTEEQNNWKNLSNKGWIEDFDNYSIMEAILEASDVDLDPSYNYGSVIVSLSRDYFPTETKEPTPVGIKPRLNYHKKMTTKEVDQLLTELAAKQTSNSIIDITNHRTSVSDSAVNKLEDNGCIVNVDKDEKKYTTPFKTPEIKIEARTKSGDYITDFDSVSFNVNREPAPIRIAGDPIPKTFERRKSTIAGSFIKDLKQNENFPAFPADGFNIIITNYDYSYNEIQITQILNCKIIEQKIDSHSTDSKDRDLSTEKLVLFIADEVKVHEQIKAQDYFGSVDPRKFSKKYNSMLEETKQDCNTIKEIEYKITKEEDQIKEDHRGEVYNPITGKWSFGIL